MYQTMLFRDLLCFILWRESHMISHTLCTHYRSADSQLISRHPRSIFIQKAPENSCDVLVRPEVQATFEGDMEMTLRCLETHAPGDALIERTNSMWILRFAAEAWQGWWMVLSWRSVNSWDGWGIHQKDPQGQIDVYKLMIRGTLV
jgi:hypothetical protein